LTSSSFSSEEEEVSEPFVKGFKAAGIFYAIFFCGFSFIAGYLCCYCTDSGSTTTCLSSSSYIPSFGFSISSSSDE